MGGKSWAKKPPSRQTVWPRDGRSTVSHRRSQTWHLAVVIICLVHALLRNEPPLVRLVCGKWEFLQPCKQEFVLPIMYAPSYSICILMSYIHAVLHTPY
ncbi:hypothetical protein BO94DRAFT_58501 [Aspergillus sclerotioniger CBS 115572]|uniref:Uncharacterized protein n=1 Tax=Aspergillus sclerotioniger CBS 115572 TaxID=1450535 RepID=A0A317WSP9_9EURO|nr:hypothetical protein BO94DRAFT_58501 [Aspergillus sclerotioniger CBS 115572]PWY87918.1 hypothetical protein BO94DRAFT_58501 [Aspergillus sclerotioniger CBS 115572]